jgi:excisionase family DNA binding protein
MNAGPESDENQWNRMKRVKSVEMPVSGGPRPYFTRAEVARMFGVSPATVASWARQGRLGYISTLGGHRRYPRDQILALLTDAAIPRGAGSHEGRAHT